jgi:hypothetical protein
MSLIYKGCLGILLTGTVSGFYMLRSNTNYYERTGTCGHKIHPLTKYFYTPLPIIPVFFPIFILSDLVDLASFPFYKKQITEYDEKIKKRNEEYDKQIKELSNRTVTKEEYENLNTKVQTEKKALTGIDWRTVNKYVGQQNEKLYKEKDNQKREGTYKYRGGLMELVSYGPTCWNAGTPKENVNSKICWSCGKRH